ncbi:zinc finger protein-related [Striga hermonthica]|uniref:Zinc finger protein-related n=1 Tax=Striga hermonthica TaxID=68872 RepID=A0A9N7MVS0_STRHE|nr:zinc finger protein-related [Striga hermonthica]
MGEKKKDNNSTVWFSLRKSLHCKSEPSDVHTPKTRKHLGSILTRKSGRSGCSRSISNLKDVIHGSKRHLDRPPSCSPRSIGSSEFVNPIAHEVILSNSRCELKITGYGGFHEGFGGGGDGGGGSTFVGTLRPGTPGPGGHPTMHYFNPSFRNSLTPPRKMGSVLGEREKRASFEKDGGVVSCHKCGEQFVRWEALELHHLSKHAVTELVEGDSSRKIVEIICRSSWLKPDNPCVKIDRVLKVHNTQKTLIRFEEYRESVKSKAGKLPKKHPRCLADGNELLRFYGTTISCPLGTNGSSSLCTSEKCSVCRVIRNGFSGKMELKHGVGVFTTSTSTRAFESIESVEDGRAVRKALIVCRVVAGRVHRPMENVREMAGQTGFDSLAGKVGAYSNIEELYLLDPKALLPCFVVICKA